MNEERAKHVVKDLRTSYANAVLAFNVASATLILEFAANLRPADEQIAAEEDARAAVVAARQNLWGGVRQSRGEARIAQLGKKGTDESARLAARLRSTPVVRVKAELGLGFWRRRLFDGNRGVLKGFQQIEVVSGSRVGWLSLCFQRGCPRSSNSTVPETASLAVTTRARYLLSSGSVLVPSTSSASSSPVRLSAAVGFVSRGFMRHAGIWGTAPHVPPSQAV